MIYCILQLACCEKSLLCIVNLKSFVRTFDMFKLGTALELCRSLHMTFFINLSFFDEVLKQDLPDRMTELAAKKWEPRVNDDV